MDAHANSSSSERAWMCGSFGQHLRNQPPIRRRHAEQFGMVHRILVHRLNQRDSRREQRLMHAAMLRQVLPSTCRVCRRQPTKKTSSVARGGTSVNVTPAPSVAHGLSTYRVPDGPALGRSGGNQTCLLWRAWRRNRVAFPVGRRAVRFDALVARMHVEPPISLLVPIIA